jgi:acetylglutamate kinase
MDKDDDSSVIPEIDKKQFTMLKERGVVADGMLPKLTNSFKAIDSGVARVVIKHARNLLSNKGTTLL